MKQVKDVIHNMHHQYKPVLEKMMDREGLSSAATVEGVLKYFTHDKVLTNEENVALLALGGAESKTNASKFAPQLSFAQRCQVLGLHRIGYNADILSKAFGVDRRTVIHIYNELSTRYRNVRNQEKVDGPAFMDNYVTPEVRAHVETFMSQASEGNNPAASGMAGTHLVKGINCEYAHRVVIGWCEPSSSDVEVPGWYYKDMDGDFPEVWFRSESDDSLKNSRSCYIAMLGEITDRI